MDSILWVEKYRPSTLDDITAQSIVIKSLKSAIKMKNIPHLIFSGPSGCGKTSTIIALSKELFGEHYKDRIIELNASDERGINVIRKKIKNYAKQSIKEIENIPPWKIIILDEADTMTTDSQFALRRIIEEYSKITRFCILCNYNNKIIDPLISRCSVFTFRSIENEEIYDKLKIICNSENFNCSDKLLNKIINICRGDLRKAINLLQRCYNSYDSDINIELLDEISGVIPELKITELMDNILLKDIKMVDKIIKQFNFDGYSIVNQIITLHNYILKLDISSHKKAEILYKITECDQDLLKGCDEYIQFLKLVYYIMIII